MNSFSSLFQQANVSLINLGINLEPRTQFLRVHSDINFDAMATSIAGTMPVPLDGEKPLSFQQRLTTWWEVYLNALGDQEHSNFPDPKQRTLRDELTSDPILGSLAATRGSANTDVFYNNRFPPASTRTVQRQRTYDNVPLAGILYPVLLCLANDFSVRQKINVRVSLGTPIPAFFQEKLNSCRQSVCGNLNITPTVSGVFSDEVIELLNLKGTIYDYRWLTSDVGLDALFSFFGRINSYSSNYIKFVTGKPVPINAGFTTTETSVTCETGLYEQPLVHYERRSRASTTGVNAVSAEKTVDITPVPSTVDSVKDDTLLRIAPGHSYGQTANQIQLVDSYIMNRTLIDGSSQPITIGLLGPTCQVSSSTLNIALYAIKRVVHDIHNSSNYDSKQVAPVPQPRVPSDASTPKISAKTESRKQKKEHNHVAELVDNFTNLLRSNLITQHLYFKLVQSVVPAYT